MRDGPLTGTRVLDLTNVLAGPYCSYQLALLGAEVIKIEAPGSGDLARQLGADPELNAIGLGTSFLAQNAGKKSVVVDLKSEEGKLTFAKLVEDADVLVENFRPGVLARLGFPWSRLEQLNPRLVYSAISGFGQTGPMSQRPAYDQIIQGLSGMMSITGTRDTAPLRVGFPICDTIGGLAAAMAINAALAGRARTGRGCFIDVSMLEAALSAMGWVVSNYLISGHVTEPMGDQNATAAPSGTFEAADGPLNIAANRQEQYVALCRAINRPDLIDDVRFQDRDSRKANREPLNRELNEVLRSRPALEWEETLSAAGVPAARILTINQALGLEQLAARGFIAELPMPGGLPRQLRVVGNGAVFDGRPSIPVLPPPLLGEHDAEHLPEATGHAAAQVDSAAAS
jgi:crotonobetainyl-CoA:carnitine CoA-transferase CaiB-like acyl-CoA transferase